MGNHSPSSSSNHGEHYPPMVHHHHRAMGNINLPWLITIRLIHLPHGLLRRPWGSSSSSLPWPTHRPWFQPSPTSTSKDPPIGPWIIISSLRLISSYSTGAETKPQKAQARYKYGPIFRMSVVPRATGPSSWNPRSSIFRFPKSSNLLHALICARLLISDFSVFPFSNRTERIASVSYLQTLLCLYTFLQR